MNNHKRIIFILKRIFGSQIDKNKFMMSADISKKKDVIELEGFYDDWIKAKADSVGYNSKIIFEKVKKAALDVKKGKAAYERDGVLFYNEDYNWPLISILLKIAIENGGKLNLVDFGGSLGSTYFQHKRFLSNLKVRWNIVEQTHFADFGEKYIADGRLLFFKDLSDCIKKTRPKVFMASGSIQYIEDPFKLIETVIKANFEHIIFDKFPIIEDYDHKILVQRVYPPIYKGSYPLRVFNFKKFMNLFVDKYNLEVSFNDESFFVEVNAKKISSNGFYFRRIS